MKRKIVYGLVTFILLAGLIAIPASAEESGGDIFPGEEIEPEVFYLMADGEVMEPDIDGNYILTNDGDTVEFETTGPLECSITLNGKWKLRSTLNINGTLFVQSGKFETKSNSIIADSIYLGEYNDYTSVDVDLGYSLIDVFVFAARGSAVILKADKAAIACTLLFDNAVKKGHKYSSVTIKNKDHIYGFIEGASEFDSLTVDSDNGVYITEDIKVKNYKVNRGQVKAGKTERNKDGETIIDIIDGAPITITE